MNEEAPPYIHWSNISSSVRKTVKNMGGLSKEEVHRIIQSHLHNPQVTKNLEKIGEASRYTKDAALFVNVMSRFLDSGGNCYVITPTLQLLLTLTKDDWHFDCSEMGTFYVAFPGSLITIAGTPIKGIYLTPNCDGTINVYVLRECGCGSCSGDHFTLFPFVTPYEAVATTPENVEAVNDIAILSTLIENLLGYLNHGDDQRGYTDLSPKERVRRLTSANRKGSSDIAVILVGSVVSEDFNCEVPTKDMMKDPMPWGKWSRGRWGPDGDVWFPPIRRSEKSSERFMRLFNRLHSTKGE